MTRVRSFAAAALAMLVFSCGATATHGGARRHASDSVAPRPVPAPLFGVTVDDISALRQIVASSRLFSHRPTTRVYFDVTQPPGYYAKTIRALHPDSYLMGELLDSSDETKISDRVYEVHIKSYLHAFGPSIDIWEIGNEVNGDWLGSYRSVSVKLTEAYHAVAARRYRTALTLYYNAGCGDGIRELSPIAFTRRYVPIAVRDGVSYVLLSYYEDNCRGIRPSTAQWISYFKRLHHMYPQARLGFGEIGMDNPVTRKSLAAARALMTHYYGLRIDLPYYIGGYFWWYYAEDCVPAVSKPLWPVLNHAFESEASAR